MPFDRSQISTGLPGLDQVFTGLRAGDNVVWQVDSLDDYAAFVTPFCRWARRNGRRLIYFRFAKHSPLCDPKTAEVREVSPEAGFESFITQIHDVIEGVGEDAYYVFDSMSDLSLERISDRMLGNFFVLTCPYLFTLNTIAYHVLLRNFHSFHASSPIAQTTQILVDVYNLRGSLYLHPRKVEHRYSPTMHMLHVWEGDQLRPVTESYITTEVLAAAPWAGSVPDGGRGGPWTRTFEEAQTVLRAYQRGQATATQVDEACKLTRRIGITRDGSLAELADRYLNLEDILRIRQRIVPSGLIGGKAVGMLLARRILEQHGPRWSSVLEPHDSFYIASENFYTYLVQNHVWLLRQKQKNPDTCLDGAAEARQRMFMGGFPDYMRERCQNMLDYFGNSPIIVRSSSLLEDAYGNTFAGKYDSVFCASQGPRHIRLDEFLQAVRRVYASSMSDEALVYRKQRGVLDKDEQMALLVQRVSGARNGSLYFPHVAGVALSQNPYVWDKSIDPRAGVVRMVFGLGTRAVDRSDDDYTRVVALNAPTKRPEHSFDDVRRHAQRRVDVLDLETNQLVSYDFVDVARRCPHLPLSLLASRDEELARMAAERGRETFPWVLTFDRMLEKTAFASDMREMLATLQEAYGCPVEIEFTLNFLRDGSYRINLLQCRPITMGLDGPVERPDRASLRPEDVVMEARGAVVGQGRSTVIDRVIYVSPGAYSRLPDSQRHEVASVIGELTHVEDRQPALAIMLMGPGRWGTSTPSLGVPVSFKAISPVSVLCEIVAMHEDLVPDVSLGTHFFNGLIEMEILYVAVFPRGQDSLNVDYFERAPNRLPEILPAAGRWAEVVRVIDPAASVEAKRLHLCADPMAQSFLCYLKND
ncbi:MAG: pyruvate, phosphate dikinase [Deltaproteobacteria bacterium]|nr:pyruvate, phosphate dikinase [Deltaproteobacteria bacterium]